MSGKDLKGLAKYLKPTHDSTVMTKKSRADFKEIAQDRSPHTYSAQGKNIRAKLSFKITLCIQAKIVSFWNNALYTDESKIELFSFGKQALQCTSLLHTFFRYWATHTN